MNVKKKTSRMLALVIAMSGVLALAGCGASTTSSSVEPNTAPASSQQTADTTVDEIEFSMPEEFSIQFQVHNDDAEREDYLMSMTKCKDGVWLDIGETGERYLFKRMDNGKYLFCEHEPYTDRYYSTMLTPEVQKLIDAGAMSLDMVTVKSTMMEGYTDKIESLFTPYQRYIDHLEFLGEEAIGGVPCNKYAVRGEIDLRPQNMYFWIDPNTGLCRKAVYEHEFITGSPEIKSVECVLLETENLELPEYDPYAFMIQDEED